MKKLCVVGLICLLLSFQMSYASLQPSCKTNLDTTQQENTVWKRIKNYNGHQKRATGVGVGFLTCGVVAGVVAGNMIGTAFAEGNTTKAVAGIFAGVGAGAIILKSVNIIIDAHNHDNQHDIYRPKGK